MGNKVSHAEKSGKKKFGTMAAIHENPARTSIAKTSIAKTSIARSEIHVAGAKTSDSAVPKAKTRKVVGLFNYTKRGTTDIDVQVGQIFDVINDDDKNWFYVQDASNGIKGFIPSNYVAEDQPVEEYIFKDFDRIQAEVLLSSLNEPGRFIVRESDKTDAPYTLSMVNEKNEICHYRIHYNKSEGFTLGTGTHFENLKKLIEHHKQNIDVFGCRLTTVAYKASPQVVGLGKDIWEVDRNNIRLVNKLGSGNFGDVWKGLWNETTVIAVKTLKEGKMSALEFLKEAEVMKSLQHPNLVQLLAVCTSGKPIYIITEFMSNGALKKYLNKNSKKLGMNILMSMILQVCNGMKYLELNKYVHRDLAARNVLVGDDLTCKVADFGMTLLNEGTDSNNNIKLPIKWTAPEAFKEKLYSVKSDVWSFGVLMWEIFTFGDSPYGNMSNLEAIAYVTEGRRLQPPKICPEHIYRIMLTCWLVDPISRPSFASIYSQIESHLYGQKSIPSLYINVSR